MPEPAELWTHQNVEAGKKPDLTRLPKLTKTFVIARVPRVSGTQKPAQRLSKMVLGCRGTRAEDSDGRDVMRQVEKVVRWVWRAVLMPALFGLVGASINFAQITGGYIGKACAIVIAGAAPSPSQTLNPLPPKP